MNVQKGQEFIVYHPQFTGNVSYMFDDGRTRRTLGICPRIPVGRIIAFKIEQEISFCKVTDNKFQEQFKPDSHLEAIPLGSISHLLSRDDFLTEDEFQLSTRGEISSKCKVAEKGNIPVMAVVFNLVNEDSLFKDRGSAFINKCLATIYQEIQENFSDEVLILKVKETELGVVWISDDDDEIINASKVVIANTKTSLHNLPDIRAGLYLGEKTFEFEGDNSNLSWEWAIDYAYFASVTVKYLKTTKQEFFTPKTAAKLLYSYYQSKQFDKALSDYHEFRKRGIEYSHVENRASLCCWSMPDRNDELLIEISDKAIELNKNNSNLWSNSGFFNYYLDKINIAYEKFMHVIEFDPSYHFSDVYLVSVVDTIISVYNEGNCDFDIQQIKPLIERAVADSQKDKQQALYSKFKKVLDALE